jgi:membrane-associated phospholipid phosphatase
MLNRLLPRGTGDLLRQILLFCGAYWLYRLVRGVVDGQVGVAFEHARQVIALEHHVGLFIEPHVQSWATSQTWLIDAASWMYLNSHFVVTTTTLAFIYLFRNEHFYFVRNMFMVAMGIALIGYLVYPTAPPRMLPEWGFLDSVADFTGVNDSASANLLVNPYAAVPSMHVGFALMLAVPMIRMARRVWLKALWGVYPLVITFVVVSTGNHFMFDALTGALTAGVSALAAQALFARLRPDVWAWQPVPETSGVPAPAPA